ncbi:hypothetical protein GCM10017707_27150 [Paenarthrobacter aurescens]
MCRQHPDTYPFDGFHKPQGLQNPDSFTDHGAGDFEFVFQMLGQHDMACRKGAADDSGAQVLYGAVVKAG